MLSSPTATKALESSQVSIDEIQNVEYIKELLAKHNDNPNFKDQDGTPLLALAITHEAFETTKYLLEKKADLHARDAKNNLCVIRFSRTSPGFYTACYELALERGYWPIISRFLTENTSTEEIKQLPSTLKSLGQNTLTLIEKNRSFLLYVAIKKHNLKAVEFILKNKTSVNVTSEKLGTPLGFAIKCLAYPTNAAWVKKESANYQAINPLMYEIIELLLKYDAIPRDEIRIIEHRDTFSPLTYSVYRHDTKLLELLLAHNPHFVDLQPMEATTQFLRERDASKKTPLAIAIVNKSRKMYDYLSTKSPDLILNDNQAFAEFFNQPGDYAKFMNEILTTLPLAKRKILFQAYTTNKGEAGDNVVNFAMFRNSLSYASTLLKNGANLPIVTNKNGNARLNRASKKKLSIGNWKEYFADYLKDLKAAEATPSLRDLSANVIYDHTHQNKSATKQLKGYLPHELFELYQSTPQRRAKQENHFKPVIRECLENALSVNKDVDENETKKAKTSP